MTTSGLPCVFPFVIYNVVRVDTCIKDKKQNPYCPVKVDEKGVPTAYSRCIIVEGKLFYIKTK